ncbi:MAG: hypothetical protein GY850_14090 [bacterium]|nr:hypothetical protein [bacterium]
MDWNDIFTKICTGLVIGFVIIAFAKITANKLRALQDQDEHEKKPDEKK